MQHGHLPEHNQPRVTFGSCTDVGLIREHNEDNFIAAPPLYAVCDGMGGHAAGEVASEIAVNVLSARAPHKPDANALGQAVEEANIAVLRGAAEGRGRQGMGTTCTAAILDGEHLVVAQVGDSRAYLLHAGMLQQLTRDHSLVGDLVESGQITPEEARIHPQRSVITRALGSDPHMQADLYEIGVHTGDRLLLCSDGLYSMVDDLEIASILSGIPDPQNAANELVAAALDAGGHDNITVVVADATGLAEARRTQIARKTKVTAIVTVALLVAIIAGAVFGFNYLTTNSAYLGEVDGKVAVYQGVPGDLFGMQFSNLQTVSDVSIDDLPPGVAKRVKNNEVRCDSLQSAYDLVHDYKSDAEITARVNASKSANGSSSSSADAAGEGGAAGAADAAAEGAQSAEGANAEGTGAGANAATQGDAA